MFKENLKFRFPKGLSLLSRMKLRKTCKKTDLDAPDYSGMISLMLFARDSFNLTFRISMFDKTTLFSFEYAD